MPQLIPPISVDSIEPYSEQQVIAELMAQLPKDCKLYHNFEFVKSSSASSKSAGRQLQEGEVDAVILWPEKGLLVLEIKGGQIEYCVNSHSWTTSNRRGRFPIKDPMQQARRNMHELIAAIERELGEKLTGTLNHGYAVVFPTSRTEGGLPHSFDEAIICDASRLGTIGRFIDGALKSWRRENALTKNNGLTTEQIHRAMLPAFRLIPSLKSRVSGESEVLHRLTTEQSSFLDYAANMKRMRIDGVAGSGKTLLAVEQCRRLAKEGSRTLLLCYNKSLASWLQSTLADDENSDNISAMTFHDLCESACAEAKIEFKPENSDEFWVEQTAELLADASSSLEPYDAIIVDEGQDFYGTWWLVIEDLLKDDGRLVVFCDPQQDIFNADGLDALDVGDRIMNLPVNCRNTQSIASHCEGIISANASSHVKAPKGSPVEVKVLPDDGKRLDYVKELVTNLIKEEGLSSSQIAILSPWRKENTCLSDIENIARIPLTNSIEEWDSGNGVLCTTIRAFKGLEADVLLLIDIPSPGEHRVFSVSDYYVGCSRAKSVLYVVAKQKADIKQPKAA